MPGPHDEHTFEIAVVHEMTTLSGWTERPVRDFDRDLLLIPDDIHEFLVTTQPQVVEQLQQRLGDSWLRKTCEIIAKGLKKPGDTLMMLRKGKVVAGVPVKLAFYKPTHAKNPQTVARYEANRLTIVRQVSYSAAHGNTLDFVLFVNGLPVADAELKNGIGQMTDDAVDQYQNDRDQRETFFYGRSVVHFAVDPNTVMMATTVGTGSRFLPFNRGSSPLGLAGAGNYQPADGSHPTSYLWRDVWQRDAWLDLIQSFIHLQPADPEDPASTPTPIFPRYHQWDCVLRYVARAREHGPGRNELAMHSTGSGKTMTQAWLAHRLANLFDDDGEKTFDKVVVLSDRRVLDRNMQRQIEQFEPDTAKGMVESITGTSQDLRAALESKTAKIIVTTIQKFPYIVRDVTTAGQRFAVVIDEAHSSQTGESAQAMQQALTSADAGNDEALLNKAAEFAAEYEADEDDDPAGDLAALVAKSRGRKDTISMFAFTATPKAKTLNQFGQLDEEGVRRPTHVYSMRQAIDEKFIMDMLENYTTYKSYWRIATRDGSSVNSEEVEKSKAIAAVRRFAMLHPHNVSQKVQVIVEHFRERVQHRINGRAKAMIVTASRLHAIRYKRALDAYISAQGYDDLRTLVAFSGRIIDPDDPGEPYTESGMNGFLDTQNRRPVRQRRLPGDGRGREVPDRLLAAADPYDLCRQEAHGAYSRSDPLQRQPDPPAQTQHVRARLHQRRCDDRTRLLAVHGRGVRTRRRPPSDVRDLGGRRRVRHSLATRRRRIRSSMVRSRVRPVEGRRQAEGEGCRGVGGDQQDACACSRPIPPAKRGCPGRLPQPASELGAPVCVPVPDGGMV